MRPSFRVRRVALTLFSVAAAVVATGWVVRLQDVPLPRLLASIPLQAHALALLAFFVEIVSRGIRVWCAARGLDLPLRLPTSVGAQLAGDALGAVTPSRVGSDPAKLLFLRRDGIRLGSSGALLVAEMASEASVLSVIALLMLLGPWSPWWSAGVAAYAVVVASLGMLALALSRASHAHPPRIWTTLRLGRARWESLDGTLREFRSAAGRLRDLRPRWIVAMLLASTLHIGARMAVLPALVLPIAQEVEGAVGETDVAALVVRPFVVLYATALLPPPGGAGGVELTFASLLRNALPPDLLAACLVWWRWYTFYLSALLGGVALALLRGLPNRPEAPSPAE